jgi:hypothetical protein
MKTSTPKAVPERRFMVPSMRRGERRLPMNFVGNFVESFSSSIYRGFSLFNHFHQFEFVLVAVRQDFRILDFSVRCMVPIQSPLQSLLRDGIKPKE